MKKIMEKLRHIKLGGNDWASVGSICNLIRFDYPTIITGYPNKNYIVLVNNNDNLVNYIDVEAVKKNDEIDFIRVNSSKQKLSIGPVLMSRDTLDWQIKNLGNRKKILSSFAKVLNRNGLNAHLREFGKRNDLVIINKEKEYKILGVLDIENGFSGMLTLKWNEDIVRKYIKGWKEKSSTGWDIKGLWELTKKRFDIESEIVNQIAEDHNLELFIDTLSEKELKQIKEIRKYTNSSDWIFKNIKKW